MQPALPMPTSGSVINRHAPKEKRSNSFLGVVIIDEERMVEV